MVEEKPCGEHTVRIEHLESQQEQIWDTIDKLRNRLPNWAVFLIAFLSGGLGWALQWGFTMARIAATGK
jgi:uncharacterized protein involved in cysteine biosynthesis